MNTRYWASVLFEAVCGKIGLAHWKICLTDFLMVFFTYWAKFQPQIMSLEQGVPQIYHNLWNRFKCKNLRGNTVTSGNECPKAYSILWMGKLLLQLVFLQTLYCTPTILCCGVHMIGAHLICERDYHHVSDFPNYFCCVFVKVYRLSSCCGHVGIEARFVVVECWNWAH